MIKITSLKNYDIKNPKSVTLNGISPSAPLKTQGEIEIQLQLYKNSTLAKFHLINNFTNIPFDGLLGQDFFQEQKSQINFDKSTISIKAFSVPIPIFSNTPQLVKSQTLINARTETVILADIINPLNLKEGIMKSQSLNKENDLLIPNAIVNISKENQALITIINASNDRKLIRTPRLAVKPMPQNEEKINAVAIYNLNKKSKNSDRLKILNQTLRLDHLNPEEKLSVKSICEDFEDIFYLPGDYLTKTNAITCDIRTVNDIPIHVKTFRYPEVHKAEVSKQIDKMLKQDIIKPSMSPWSSPLWVVPKKLDASGERKWRVVIDYRSLNNIIIGDAYPMPHIDDILDQLGHSQYFTTLDLANGYHQVPINPKDAAKTAFSTSDGHYEFTRMPFGLKNAPAYFQRLMNSVLLGLNKNQCFVYLDDIVIYGSSLEDHNTKLINVFQRLRNNQLQLQPDKCEFMRQSCEYLGHIITKDGVKPNPRKIEAIKIMPRPQNAKHIKIFLGMVGYYRKFVKNFATIAKPLTQLLKNVSVFLWSDAQQKAFQELKEVLMKNPLLQYPSFSEPFIVTTDASNVGIGGVLSQLKDSNDLPVAYYSRTLNKAEVNYLTTEKELLAIICTIENFRPYLYGKTFTIYTDRRPLQWLFNCKNPSSKLVRCRLRLNEYQ